MEAVEANIQGDVAHLYIKGGGGGGEGGRLWV